MDVLNIVRVNSVQYDSIKDFRSLLKNERTPLVIRNCVLGACKNRWTVNYLSEKLDSTSVKIHAGSDNKFNFLSKNFVYKTVSMAEFLREASSKNDCPNNSANIKYYYLRSIGTDRRGRDVANIADHFPEIAADLVLPDFIDEADFFSSVLRISSKDVQIWTHYDVMDNILIQVSGEKRVVLFSPSDAHLMYLDGDKSRVIDIDSPDLNTFPDFVKAKRFECTLYPGDILYIPSLWFHNTKALSFSIGVNMFWKHLPHNFYDKSDVYGNKDPVPAAKVTLPYVINMCLRVLI